MKTIKKFLKRPYELFSMWFFDPLPLINKLKALPFFIKNFFIYKKLNKNKKFNIGLGDIWYSSYERFTEAATVPAHYFYQDIWAARILYSKKIREHVDVGSSLAGFISHILVFCRVCYVDIRPLNLNLDGFEFLKGSIMDMPFEDNSIPSLSCLHVIEHIGLGRYGDPLEPEGYICAAKELMRVLKPGGLLLLGTPVGRERLCFDAHRIFDPETIINIFLGLSLVEFSLVDDAGNGIIHNASFEKARSCNYGCGLFLFEKKIK